MKRYFRNWKKIYQFAEFGDMQNFFIELAYATEKQAFASSLGVPLINKTAIDGQPIFRNENIDFQKYKLFNERIEEQTNDLIFVYETYGFAPEDAYVDYTAEPVQFFGKKDPSGAVSTQVKRASYFDVKHEQIILSEIDDISKLNKGDTIIITRPRFTASGITGKALRSPELVIVDKTDSTLVVNAFSFIVVETGDTSTSDTITLINQTYGNYCTISKEASTTAPQTRITNVKNVINFFDKFPEPVGKFVVSTATEETDTITDTTTPSIEEWKEKVANGEYIDVQDSVVDVVFPKTFYKRTRKQVKAK